MAGIGLLVLLALTVALPVFVAAAVLWVSSRRHLDDGDAVVRAARRHEALVTSAAALAAVVCAVVILSLPVTWSTDYVPTPSAVGLLQTTGPFVVAVVFSAVRAMGELTWPRPAGQVRTAPLVRRTAWSLGGRRLRWLLTTTCACVVAVVTFGLTAGDDGRQLTTTGADAGGDVVAIQSGPYPGWPFGVPILAALLVATAAVYGTLRLITRRAPLAGVPAALDDSVRATSASRLLAAAQLCVGGAFGILLVAAGGAIADAGRNAAMNGVSGTVLDGVRSDPWLLLTVGTCVMILGGLAAVVSGFAALPAILPRGPRAERLTAHQQGAAPGDPA